MASTEGNKPQHSTVSQGLAIAALVAAATVLAVSFVQGPPQPLPGVALGWPVVLYAERAALAALLITGIGGVLHRLLTGGQVSEMGGGALPSVAVEDATRPTEALKEGVDADVVELNDRLFDVEERLERLEPSDPSHPAGQ